MSSGWGVDINIDTGLFCSCYMEQGRPVDMIVDVKWMSSGCQVDGEWT